ncbi:MAG: helix-turn-helix domain-containing protein [Burkholderiales bacterium]
MSGFGEKVREYRKAWGITQKALAEAAGLTSTYFNRIEKGTRKIPKVETVLALVAALHRVVHLTSKEAEELVELAGYSPTVLKVGRGLVYDAPPLDAPLLPDTFERFFTALGKLGALPRQRQEKCLETMIELIESQVAKVENGSEGN